MEKRGLRAALAAAGLTAVSWVGWADEMRVGLRGMVRRVWGRRGVKVRQRLQLRYAWRYLLLVVDGRTGKVWWAWTKTMKAEEVVPLVRGMQQAGLAAVVWDRAPSHRDARVRAVGLPLIEQPPYAPELNPAERLIQELRREVEGTVYATIEEKVAAVTAVLEQWDADPERVRRLTGWAWIDEARTALPQPVDIAA